ncbi:MAG: hypothetical protein NWF11_08335 [Candidatus Bathyarchaeota archaeon]|nr:hypothetical protein [Candidatus Bathyarchaeota archaeon]
MVVIARVTTEEDFHNFLEKLELKGKIFAVKPNWKSPNISTSAQTLDWLLSTLRGNIKIIDGYTGWRNQLNTGSKHIEIITPSNARIKWQWIKEQDKWFLKYTGIDKVLKKHKVEYINVTEEVWSMKTLEPDEVRDLVDPKYGVVLSQEMYNFIPTRIYELRGSTFISLNRSYHSRGEISLSTSNLFTLIPDPSRHIKWSGKNRTRLPQSIVDINKLYRSIFSPCYWINEIKEKGIFVASKNSVEADAVTAKLIGLNPQNINYLSHLTKVFGDYDKRALTKIPSLNLK